MKAKIFRHLAFEDLGAFAFVLTQKGCEIEYAEMGVDAPDDQGADLLIILGGPIGAYEDDIYPWLKDEIKTIARRLKAGLPTLGICLGAQLMARALGARVYPGRAREIGFAPLRPAPGGNPLLPFLAVPVLHWHGDTFDLPEGATHLAATPDCDNQAFSFGAHALAFQFHPEAQEEGFERWLIGHAGEIAAAPGISVPLLRRQMRQYGSVAAAKGREIFTRWLALNHR